MSAPLLRPSKTLPVAGVEHPRSKRPETQDRYGTQSIRRTFPMEPSALPGISALECRLGERGLATRCLLTALIGAVLTRHLRDEQVTLAVERGDCEFVPVVIAPRGDATWSQLLDDVARQLQSDSPEAEHELAQAAVAADSPPFRAARWEGASAEGRAGSHWVGCAFVVEQDERRLALRICFDNVRLDPMSMGFLLDSIMEAAGDLARPHGAAELTLSSLSILSSSTRHTIIRDFNGTRHPYPTEQLTIDLIESQARRRGQATAIVFEDEQLSYGELDGKASDLAMRLRERGVGKGDVVGLLMRSSLELPIAMVAAMKLGAVFIPLDELWPAQRVATVLRYADPRLVLSNAGSEARHAHAGDQLAIDAGSLSDSSTLASAPLGPEDLMYGFPTSGSTGPPKCALNTQRGLLNRFLYMTRRFHGGPWDVTLQNSAHVFDSSLWQLLWPLTTGGRVVVPSATQRLDLGYVLSLIERHGVTMTDFVPSVFNLLTAHLERTPSDVPRLRSLRRLLIGGEEINAKYCRRFLALAPEVTLTNTYGPTEAAIGMVFHCVHPAGDEPIPIGRPIDNTYAVVLDEQHRLLPPGALGELFIGGDCLGTGYLGDPERTQRAWIENPIAELPGATLYRTGDLAHQGGDGLLYFAGRADQQVKIGGVRVELGEIEHALIDHPAINEAAVCAEEGPAGKRLVGYMTVRSTVSAEEILRHLGSVLPKQMIPSRLVFVDALPLTHNGKVDRAQLQALGGHEDRSVPRAQAASEEAMLTSIWLELLPLDGVGLDESFFDVGGDSLLALHLAWKVADGMRTRMPLSAIYEHPTIRGLASVIRAERAAGRSDGAAGMIAQAKRDLALLERSHPPSPPGASCASSGTGLTLFTGASGFVGAHILAELLDSTSARVLFLSRHAEPRDALAQLQGTLEGYGIWRASYGARLEPLSGDLERDDLGLSDQARARVAADVESIVHCAGLVNMLHDYAYHRRANVVGTTQILHLAATGRSKTVHCLSSTSAGFDRTVDGAPAVEHAQALGYNLSKWVSEQLLADAAARGMDVTVYRLGEAMPRIGTGVANRSSLVPLLLGACVELGVYPQGLVGFDYSPVDCVARAICQTIATSPRSDSPIEVLHPEGTTLDHVIGTFRALGAPIVATSGTDFVERLQARCEAAPTRRLRALLCVVMAGTECSFHDGYGGDPAESTLSGLFTQQSPRRSTGPCDRAARWPAIDERLLEPLLANLQELAGPTAEASTRRPRAAPAAGVS
jgi:amino acid adenylation domain-containing protein/thioester reductase-like protein